MDYLDQHRSNYDEIAQSRDSWKLVSPGKRREKKEKEFRERKRDACCGISFVEASGCTKQVYGPGCIYNIRIHVHAHAHIQVDVGLETHGCDDYGLSRVHDSNLLCSIMT